MSYDQKPARMRVVSSGTAPTPQRRRGDLPATAPAPAAPVPTTAGRGGRTMLLVTLFLLGCIAGGVALPLLGLV